MDRQKRAASGKITDYRKYHLSGDLEQVVQGKVSEAIKLLQNTHIANLSEPLIIEDSTPEQLQELLQQEKDSSAKMQQQVETMKLRNKLEAQWLQQQQWNS